MSDLDLNAVAERYHRALDAKKGKGDMDADGIAAITDSVCDIPQLLAEIERMTKQRAESAGGVAGLIDWLADARSEYVHGNGTGDDYLTGQINGARRMAAILRGENDAQGWLPSWRWDEFKRMFGTEVDHD